MYVRKGNKRKKTTFAKARGYGMPYRFNQCECKSCKASPTGQFGVSANNRIRRLNAAREEVNA